MDIVKRTVTANSNKLITTNGEAVPSLISSAWNLSDINEDIALVDQNGQKVPFVIILLSEGAIKVILSGGMEYTISEALKVKDRYPEWTVGIDVKVEERYQCDDILWECIKDHKTQENWKLSLATASLWKVVVEDHEGTEDDPIPYTPPMELFNGKFYTQDGVKYKCTRDSGTPLSHDLKDLVGTYVETV